MIAESARLLISRYADGDLDDVERRLAEQMLAASEEARRYLAQIERLRDRLDTAAGPAPDLTHRILAAVRRSGAPLPRRRLLAAFGAGVLAGAVFIGLAVRQPTPVASADIPDQVLAAQNRVESLSVELSIVERGLHPEVPERVYTGSLLYSAPETLAVTIEDRTAYPSPQWLPNDAILVVDRDRAWSSSVPRCPSRALPGCIPTQPRLMAVEDRDPFPDRAPAPLDLVVPAAGFTRSGPPEMLGERKIQERDAVGVAVTAAQLGPLLEGLTGAGNWRKVHPTDRVELWLDGEALVPLSMAVYPADTPDRSLWAIRHHFQDQAGTPILEVTWTVLAINQPLQVELPPPPTMEPMSAGFEERRPSDLDGMTPANLPSGMALHRAGIVSTEKGPEVAVAAWTDGRAWVKVSWTRQWQGNRLFGDLGDLVRRVDLGEGLAYLNERGDRVALHGDGIDVAVTGSLPTETLLEITAGLGIVGGEVPESWAEAATADLEEARRSLPGLLLPTGLDGFAPPAVRVEPEAVILAYAGPGNRAFLLTQTAAGLSPPLEANVRGVVVRGMPGRYSPDRGLLEWTENGLTIGLSSVTLALEELLVIAESLEEA